MRASKISYFVTLTYSDDNLFYGTCDPILYKRHLQLHFKKLRKRLEARSIKYYAVGEYGDRSNPGRPHYHYILFYRGNLDRFKLLQYIKESWDLGISQVLPVHGAQGYVTKYILKFDRREHEVKPFSMISHGIGIDYLSDEMISYHRRNLIPFATKPGGYHINLPRYYKNKIFNEYERLLMKARADVYRKDLECKKLDMVDFRFRLGLNPFCQSIENYKTRLYNAMKLYKQKKRL